MKVGIMGGTFDPIHMGHLILGEEAYEELRLDRVIYLPAGNPPHKQNRTGGATDEERLEMVRLAVANNPHFTVSDYEMRQKRLSYTSVTLTELKAMHPDHEYYFIIGADSLFDFDKWHEPGVIASLSTLVIATREEATNYSLVRKIRHLEDDYNAQCVLLNSGNFDISSRELRKRIEKGRDIRYYVPDPVRDYIREHGLYGQSAKET